MKKLSLGQMAAVKGGQVSGVFWQGSPNSGSGITVNTGTIGSLHYTWLDCVGFFGGLAGMTGAAFATLGIGAIVAGLISFSGMVASAGNCEGWLKS